MNIIGFGLLQVNEADKIAFENLMTFLITEIRKKRGCEECYWSRNPEQADGYFMYTEFSNQEDFAAYRASSVMDIINKQIVPLVQDATFKYFKAVGLGITRIK